MAVCNKKLKYFTKQLLECVANTNLTASNPDILHTELIHVHVRQCMTYLIMGMKKSNIVLSIGSVVRGVLGLGVFLLQYFPLVNMKTNVSYT